MMVASWHGRSHPFFASNAVGFEWREGFLRKR
jgi:hypothetical protein